MIGGLRNTICRFSVVVGRVEEEDFSHCLTHDRLFAREMVNMIELAIVEDDEAQIWLLQQYVDRYASEHDVDIHTTVHRSAEDLLNNRVKVVDLVFMDIQLPGINGMEAVRRVRECRTDVPVIFITSLAQYAIEGYRVHALDFVVKPVSYSNFEFKMTRAMRAVHRERGASIAVRSDEGLQIIETRNIRYIEVRNHDLTYHLTTGEMKTRGSVTERERELRSAGFVRCNVCYLVNMRHIVNITDDSLILDDGTVLAVSRARRRSTMEAFARYMGGVH